MKTAVTEIKWTMPCDEHRNSPAIIVSKLASRRGSAPICPASQKATNCRLVRVPAIFAKHDTPAAHLLHKHGRAPPSQQPARLPTLFSTSLAHDEGLPFRRPSPSKKILRAIRSNPHRSLLVSTTKSPLTSLVPKPVYSLPPLSLHNFRVFLRQCTLIHVFRRSKTHARARQPALSRQVIIDESKSFAHRRRREAGI